jgi:hypothetical protein
VAVVILRVAVSKAARATVLSAAVVVLAGLVAVVSEALAAVA